MLIVALALTGAVAVWGIVDTEGLATFASTIVRTMFRSRGWLIMLTVSAMPFVFIVLLLTVCLLKALKRETG